MSIRQESVYQGKTNERFFAFDNNNALPFPASSDFVSDAVNFRNGGRDNDR